MKRIARICTVLMSLLLAVSLGITAHATGTVTYDGDANKFLFAPGTQQSPTSLFAEFQDVMPGDVLTQQIQIKNDTANGVKIKVYLRSLGAQEDTDAFLSQLKLTVQQKEDSVLFAAPANETAQLTDWVYVGTVFSGGDITLDLKLEVPVTLSSDYQDQVGYIDWEFKVEELPVEPSDPLPPMTGDTSNIYLYMGLMVLSLAALIILLLAGKRKKKEAQG